MKKIQNRDEYFKHLGEKYTDSFNYDDVPGYFDYIEGLNDAKTYYEELLEQIKIRIDSFEIDTNQQSGIIEFIDGYQFKNL
jgi:hypothetical protein